MGDLKKEEVQTKKTYISKQEIAKSKMSFKENSYKKTKKC